MASSIYPSRLAKHEIRLLTLPASSNRTSIAPLECSLETITLSSKSSYIALSYVWGPPVFDKMILVNGTEIYVTSSLFEALYHMQKPENDITIWADAICINQKDNKEKGEQVQLMKDIYEGALHVHVWLGLSADGSDELIDTMDSIGNRALGSEIAEIYDLSIESKVGDATDESSPISITSLIEDIGFSFPYGPYKCFVQRPWWTRVWTVQELAVGRKVYFACGGKRIPFGPVVGIWHFELQLRKHLARRLAGTVSNPGDTQVLKNFIDGLPSHTTAGIMIGQRARYQRYLMDYEESPEFAKIIIQLNLTSAVTLQATDPRDHIFALLSMASDSRALGITPNYGKDCRTVYIETARALLVHGHMEILTFSQFSNLEADMPSWVPDWSRSRSIPPIVSGLSEICFCPLYNSSGDFSPGVTLHSDIDMITLPAILVGMIEDIGTPLTVEPGGSWNIGTVDDFLEELRDFHHRSDSMANNEYSSNSKRRIEVVRRTPVRDMHFDGTSGLPCRASASMIKGYDALLEDIRLSKLSRSPTISPDNPNPEVCVKAEEVKTESGLQPVSLEYLSAMTLSVGKLPFLTTTGYVGLGPATTRAGDKVYIVFGSAVPYVFRPTEDRHHLLLGPAYVYGIMDGEFLEGEIVVEDLDVI